MSRCTRSMQLALVVTGAVLTLASHRPEMDCPLDATRNQCEEYYGNGFQVQGLYLRFECDGDNSLRLKCYNSLQLDSVRAFLPRFTSALRVMYVTVTDCPPAHYAAVFAALNVTPTSPFNLDLEMDGTIWVLGAAHFADLPPLHRLTLRRSAGLYGQKAVNISGVPASVLNLPELRSLRVEPNTMCSTVPVERSNTSQLQQLYVICADAALLSNWAPPALEEVTLQSWRAVRPNPLPACDKLVKLTLVYPDVREFPAGWVARCPRLGVLHIRTAYRVSKLPARLLENATQLTSLDIIGTNMATLPAQLFADTPHLTHLDLSYNQLTQLPPQLFTNTLHLTHLDLSYNQLIQLPSSVLTLPLLWLDLGYNKLNTSVVAEVASLTELRNLSLAGNREISDLCAVNDSNVTGIDTTVLKGISSLVSLSKLERLKLQETNVSVICSGLLKDMVNLKYVDLRDTKIANLTTCSMVLSGRHCGTTGLGPLRLVYVGVKLDRVPQLPSLNNDTDVHAIDLVLSDNSFNKLVDDLPLYFQVLGLRNNSFGYMTETTARTLVSGTKRRVLLAGNRLECSCRATPALRVLHDHAAVLVGHDTLRCEDGGTIAHAIAACSALVTTA